MTQRVQYLVAGGLAILWMTVLVMQWMLEEPPQQVPLQFRTGHQPFQRAALASQEDDLAVKPFTVKREEEPNRPHKNIFVMSQDRIDGTPITQRRASVKSAKNPLLLELSSAPPSPPMPTPAELAAMAAQQQRERVLQQVREQMAQFRYVGYTERGGRQQAFVGRDNQIFILQQGDTLEEKFVVATIDQTAVTLREVLTKLEGRIELKKESSAGPS